jgi:uncharacterized coiled-coil protein SlyX
MPGERNPETSPNILTFPKTIELEQRVSRAEITMAELPQILVAQDAQIAALQQTVTMLQGRIVSLQAQLDHLFAKLGHF